ncbi:hypothetical protein ZWY2020_040913 [Hordeum vulgare]|nr:hypothetical protein ZWY2020_040913 [Hordeum vulgare]
MPTRGVAVEWGREESEERNEKGGRREDGGAPATGLASHAVLGVEDPRSPLARCRHDLAHHRPPWVLFSPNGAYMAISIQAPGEDTPHCPNVLLYMGGVTATSLTVQAKGCNKSSQIISIILRITETIALQNSMPFFDGFEWSLNQSNQPRRCFFSLWRLKDIYGSLLHVEQVNTH